MNSNVMC